MNYFGHSAAAPLDQAHGLRQMFAATRQRFVPLVHNPHVAFGGIAMERMCAAFADAQLSTLVVDAADTASTPHEVASVDLSACIEPLSKSVAFLAARGLPMRWLDARGNTSGFLTALSEAAPRHDVVLVHAGPTDLARLFAGRSPRPLLLAADQPESLTHAYASMKLLSQRLGVMAFDLLLAAPGSRQRMARIADRLASCADRFLGAAVGEWAVVDPTADDTGAPDAALRRLAAAQVASSDPCLHLPRPGAGSAHGARAGYAN